MSDLAIGEPLAYASTRLAAWAIVTGVALVDAVRFAWPLRAQSPYSFRLFALVVAVLVVECIQQILNVTVEVGWETNGNLVLYMPYVMVDTASELLFLSFLMLVAAGWNIIRHELSAKERVLIPLLIVLGFVFQVVAFYGAITGRSLLLIASAMIWFAVYLCIWTFIIYMLQYNHRQLRNRSNANATSSGGAAVAASSSTPSQQQSSAAAAATGDAESSSETGFDMAPEGERVMELGSGFIHAQKYWLYRHVRIAIILYLVASLLLVIASVLFIPVFKNINPNAYWIHVIPADVVTIALVASFAYFFRVRIDNPYTLLATDFGDELEGGPYRGRQGGSTELDSEAFAMDSDVDDPQHDSGENRATANLTPSRNLQQPPAATDE